MNPMSDSEKRHYRSGLTTGFISGIVVSLIALSLLAMARTSEGQYASVRELVEKTPGMEAHGRRLDGSFDELEEKLEMFDHEDWKEVVPQVRYAADVFATAVYDSKYMGEQWKEEYDRRHPPEPPDDGRP